MVGLLEFAAVVTSSPVAGLPQSLKPGALTACAPTTLEAAEECLTKSLSKADLATLRDPSAASAYRGALDCEIEIEWRLADATSPMALVMRDKLGVHFPSLAASMIIQDIQMRAAGSGLPWDQVRRDAATIPAGANPSTCPTGNSKPEHANAH